MAWLKDYILGVLGEAIENEELAESKASKIANKYAQADRRVRKSERSMDNSANKLAFYRSEKERAHKDLEKMHPDDDRGQYHMSNYIDDLRDDIEDESPRTNRKFGYFMRNKVARARTPFGKSRDSVVRVMKKRADYYANKK